MTLFPAFVASDVLKITCILSFIFALLFAFTLSFATFVVIVLIVGTTFPLSLSTIPCVVALGIWFAFLALSFSLAFTIFSFSFDNSVHFLWNSFTLVLLGSQWHGFSPPHIGTIISQDSFSELTIAARITDVHVEESFQLTSKTSQQNCKTNLFSESCCYPLIFSKSLLQTENLRKAVSSKRLAMPW